jgi:serine/threonine protein phosphatase PrpC
MALAAHGVTHSGRRRTNEDSMLIDLPRGFFVVADGMGGHKAGEVASSIAVRTIHDVVTLDAPATERVLVKAISRANEDVLNAAATEPDYSGMGTTVVAAFVSDDHVLFGSVGDSRLYHWGRGTLTQLTQDDSWISRVLSEDVLSEHDAQRHPMRHVLTKVVGLREDMEPSVGSRAFEPGDMLMLCSDGLHGSITDDGIASTIAAAAGVDEIAARLVDQALDGGATDNITVIVIRRE